MDLTVFMAEILVGLGGLIVIVIGFLAKLATRVAVLEAHETSERLRTIDERLAAMARDLNYLKGCIKGGKEA